MGGLVLSRKPGESILIGDDIKITVTGIQEGRARVWIDAPRDVKIVREELLKAKHKPTD